MWVPVIRFMSCDLRILMDQPAESIPLGNPSSRRDSRWFGGPKRWDLPQGAVRAVAVVMVGVLASTVRGYQQPTISIRSSSSRRTVPTHRSAEALARGARTAVMSTLIADRLGDQDWVERGVNSVSRSRTRNRNRSAGSSTAMMSRRRAALAAMMALEACDTGEVSSRFSVTAAASTTSPGECITAQTGAAPYLARPRFQRPGQGGQISRTGLPAGRWRNGCP